MIELTQEELKQHFSEPIFGQIAETADTLGMECYVVGGYVPMNSTITMNLSVIFHLKGINFTTKMPKSLIK